MHGGSYDSTVIQSSISARASRRGARNDTDQSRENFVLADSARRDGEEFVWFCDTLGEKCDGKVDRCPVPLIGDYHVMILFDQKLKCERWYFIKKGWFFIQCITPIPASRATNYTFIGPSPFLCLKCRHPLFSCPSVIHTNIHPWNRSFEEKSDLIMTEVKVLPSREINALFWILLKRLELPLFDTTNKTIPFLPFAVVLHNPRQIHFSEKCFITLLH